MMISSGMRGAVWILPFTHGIATGGQDIPMFFHHHTNTTPSKRDTNREAKHQMPTRTPPPRLEQRLWSITPQAAAAYSIAGGCKGQRV